MDLFDYTIVHCARKYGYSPDAINERRNHRGAFAAMVNRSLEYKGGRKYDTDVICRRVINLRKKGLLTGDWKEAQVLLIPTHHDGVIRDIVRAYKMVEEVEIEAIVGQDHHRWKITRIFNARTDADWHEDKVIVRIVQLRKSGKLKIKT